MKFFPACLIILTISSGLCSGQNTFEHLASLPDEEILKLAREKATSEPFTRSQRMLTFLLERNPLHSDARVFLARIHGWNKNYDSARSNLQVVLSPHPYHEDALRTMIDVELWAEDFQRALSYADKALTKYANDPEFLYSKARASYGLKNVDEATLALKSVLVFHPGHSGARTLMKTLSHEGKTHYVGIIYNVDFFNKTFSPAQNASLLLSKKSNRGSAVVSGNFASRFDMTDWQAEIDLYPKIYNGIYAYLNYGYSRGNLFPEHRAGAEIFYPVLKRFEASGGVRYLRFSNRKDVEIFTGSLGWYRETFSLLTRFFVTPAVREDTGLSAFVLLRRLWNSPDEYLGVNGSVGFSPDARTIQTSTGLATESIYNLKSQSVGIDWSHVSCYGMIFLTNLRFTRQQYAFDASGYVSFVSINVGLKKRF